MATGWRVEAVPYAEGVVVPNEPFALWQNDKNEVWVLTMQPVEIETGKSSVLEGSLAGQFPEQFSDGDDQLSR